MAFTEAPQLDAALCAAAWPTRGETEVERKGYFNKRGASNLRSIYSTYMYVYIYIYIYLHNTKLYIDILYTVCMYIYIYIFILHEELYPYQMSCVSCFTSFCWQ